MRKIRTAIIGYGRSGSTMHAGAIAANDAFDVVAVCDTDDERRQQAASRFGCAVYEDYRRMLAEERLDFISIVTRSDQHSAMACDVLNAGVHALVTKPWARDEAEARRMMEAAAATGAQLLPWLPARWGSDLLRLRALLDAGAIGKVFMVRRTVCSFGTRTDWQTERRYGGGYLLNWGPHIVDQPLVLLGREVTSVYGRMRQIINPGDAEDLFYAVLTLDDGALVQAEYTIAQDHLPTWFVQGDRGTITVHGRQVTVKASPPVRPDDPTQYSTMHADNQVVTEEEIPHDIYGDECRIYAEIAQALRGERPYPITTADALSLTRVLDAIRTSHEEDRIVPLSPCAVR